MKLNAPGAPNPHGSPHHPKPGRLKFFLYFIIFLFIYIYILFLLFNGYCQFNYLFNGYCQFFIIYLMAISSFY